MDQIVPETPAVDQGAPLHRSVQAERQFAKSVRAVMRAWVVRRKSHSRRLGDTPVQAIRPIRPLRRI